MLPVLCYGDICADLLIPYGQALLALTSTVDPDALTVRFSHGGSVANTAVTLARLGAPALFLGTAGQDAFGRALKAGLESEGVDASLLTLKEHAMTTMVLLVLDEQGQPARRYGGPDPGRHPHPHLLDALLGHDAAGGPRRRQSAGAHAPVPWGGNTGGFGCERPAGVH